MRNKTIAVLLTVFNRKDKTISCLGNIFNQKMPCGYSFDVYLTNDGCTDGTPELVRELFPSVKIIDSKGDLFWNRGMYLAWETAVSSEHEIEGEIIRGCDYYLWLNDDTFLFDNSILELLSVAEAYESKSVIVGPTLSSDHCMTTYGGHLLDNTIPEVDGNCKNVDYFNGNIVLVPSSVYKIIGNLDPYFTHSKGDFDYGLRCRENKISMIQVGKHLGECDRHSQLDKWCNPRVSLKERLSMLNRPNGMPIREVFYFDRKHANIAIAMMHVVTVLIRCLIPGLWSRMGKDKI